MSNITPLPGQAVQVVDTRYTQDVIPILDTSKFEHMQRLATVMAKMSTIPESLRGIRDGKNFTEFPSETIIANCFRIVNQSVRWGFDPFAVVDCASVVHGKLMWEGKLVAAVLDAKLGVRLNYTFTNDDKPNDKSMGVVVSGTLPGEVTPRTIEGTVAGWHRGDKSPWSNPSAWKRQLRYMGAREWARAHAPAVMLGVYTDDELDGIVERDVPAGRRATRMKDVTPSAPAIPAVPEIAPQIPAIPAIPDIPDVDQTPKLDPKDYIARLEEALSLAKGQPELIAEIAEEHEAHVADLDEETQQRADALFKVAERGKWPA